MEGAKPTTPPKNINVAGGSQLKGAKPPPLHIYIQWAVAVGRPQMTMEFPYIHT